MQPTDPRVIDAMYRPFPAFQGWAGPLHHEFQSLHSRAQELRQIRGATETLVREARQYLLRAAAFDTGALETLYATTRGLTESVAAQVATWESMVERHAGFNARRSFEAQLAAYELVFKAATEEIPLSEAWIRELHGVACEVQDTYQVRTPQGVQEQALPKGVYKNHPNHVWLSGNEFIAFAPVVDTPAEMARLVRELQTPAMLEADPVIQAAYAHYALVRIHPFADGNGRVARALASLFTARAFSTPIVIFSDQLSDYLAALRRADRGDPDDFVRFLASCVESTLEICLDQVKRGPVPTADEEVREVAALYHGRGGFPLHEVDEALYGVAEAVLEEANKQISEMEKGRWQVSAQIQATGAYSGRDGYRAPLASGGRQVSLVFATPRPAETQFATTILFWVRRDSTPGADYLLTATVRSREAISLDPLELKIDEVVPRIKVATMVRISSWMGAVLGRSLHELRRLASVSRSTKGY